MAYNATNLSQFTAAPLTRGGYAAGVISGGQPTFWVYTSADAKATVAASGYITDPLAHGMKIGDVVIVQDTATPMVSLHRVTVATADTSTGGAGATLSAGLNIT